MPTDTSAAKAPAKRRVGRAVTIVVVVGIFLGLPAARYLLDSREEADAQPPAPVVVERPVIQDAEITVRYPGNLVPDTATAIVPKVSGRLTEVAVDESDVVAAGTVIARVEDEALVLQVAQARAAWEAADAQYRQALRGTRSTQLEITRAEVEQAESELATARSNLERTRRLFDQDAVSQRDFEEAQDRFQSAETQVANARRRLDLMEEGASDEELEIARANANAARRQLELAELQLSYATVTTPLAGTVTTVLVEIGQTVGTQTVLANIVNDRLIRARMRVPERLYGRFRGRADSIPVRLLAEAYPDERFTGMISSVSSVIDPATRTFEVEVAISNVDGRLRPGMYVNAVFVVERYPAAVHVRDGAVQTRDDGRVVYVVDSGRARETAVDTRDVDGPLTLVLSGLAGDEAVIVEGAAFLDDGAAVEADAR